MIWEVCSHHNWGKRMLKIPKFLLIGLDFVAKNLKEWFFKNYDLHSNLIMSS
jgi:hypothetical protein